MSPADTEVTVRTEVKQAGGKPIPIDYALEKTPTGWMVYDFSISGVDMVLNYRSQFSQEISNGGGLDALIKSLQQKNAALNPAPAGKK
jgi:phospholipid transport system substrate-binding protein